MVDYKIGLKSHNFSFTAYIHELFRLDQRIQVTKLQQIIIIIIIYYIIIQYYNNTTITTNNNNNNNNNNIYMHTYIHTCFFFFPKLIFSTLVVASMDLHGVCFLSGIWINLNLIYLWISLNVTKCMFNLLFILSFTNIWKLYKCSLFLLIFGCL